MMRNLLFALCSLLFAFSAPAQDIASVYYENWTNNSWQAYMKYEYSYDENYYLTNSLLLMYDAQNGGWINSSQINYSNNSNGTIHSYISQLWDDQNFNWTNSQRATYSYNNSDDPSQVIYEGWNSGSWQNSMKYIYYYDGKDLLIKLDMMTWDQPSVSWKNFARQTYHNNPDSTIHDYLYQLYNTGSGTWTNNSRGTYSYSGSQKLLTTLIEVWLNNNWQNSMQQFNTYDNSDYLIHNLTQLWTQVTLSWQYNSQINYENNDDGTVNQYVYQTWDSPANAWKNSTRATYTYLPPTRINEIATSEWLVYPNPSTDHLHVCFKDGSKANLIITGLQGEPVLTLNQAVNEDVIDISALPRGVYVLTLENNGKSYSKRFVKR